MLKQTHTFSILEISQAAYEEIRSKLTEAEPGDYPEPPMRDAAILKLADAWLGCCVVWWCLLAHGHLSTLILFDAIKNRVKHELGITAAERWFVRKHADLIFWWTYESPWVKWWTQKEDDPEYLEIRQVSPDDMDDIPF
jgi:hypothetical protein